MAGRPPRRRQLGSAALRATIQLIVVALVITAVLGHVVWSILFGVFMLTVATITSSRRIEAPRAWPWVGVAIASGVLPTLAVIFASERCRSRARPWCRWPGLSSGVA